jgi:lysophospholipase L1-like esterase
MPAFSTNRFPHLLIARLVVGAAIAMTSATLLIAAAGGAVAQVQKTASEIADKVKKPKPSSHKSQRQGMFSLTRIERASIVMLGDSITERAQWAEITGCLSIANRGIGGDDSAGIVRRLDDVLRLKPNAVFLMVGVNDLHSNYAVEKIAANVEKIIARLTEAGIKVYLQSVFPVTQAYTRKLNPSIRQLNALYARMRSDKVTWLDLTPEFAQDGGLREGLNIDGLHLSTEGYRIWRDAILPIVTETCAMASQPARAARTKQ